MAISLLLLNTLLLLPGYWGFLETTRFFPFHPISETGSWYGTFLALLRRPDQDLFRISAELALVVTVFFLVERGRAARLARRGASILLSVVLLLSVYEAVVGRLFHRDANFFDDATYALNGLYLLIDLMTPARLAITVLAAGAVAALFVFLGLVVGALQRALRTAVSRRALRNTLIAFWSLYLPLGAVYGFADTSFQVRSVVARAGRNAVDSYRVARTLQTLSDEPVDAPYAAYQAVNLRSKPDIYLFMVESYGSCLATDPVFRMRYARLLDSLEQELRSDDWYVASAHSRAPVYGGISWLSIASVLTGVRISTHALYSLFVRHAADTPHLVSLLNTWGYHTITLQPPNRLRPGLPLENPFGFQSTVYADDLAYDGPSYGLWDIPDQYSLGHTHDRLLSALREPRFLFFETVSTHAPWESTPPFVDDWQELATAPTRAPDARLSLVDRLTASVRNRLQLRPPGVDNHYFASIDYDLRVLVDYLVSRVERPSLVVILGDHQPPLVADSTYSTPLHILATDSTLLAPLRQLGFQDGFSADPRQTGGLTHEGLYSLIVRLLARAYATEDQEPLVPFLKEGTSAALLVHGP